MNFYLIYYSAAVYGSMVPFMLGPLVPVFCKLLPESLVSSNSSIANAKPVMFHIEYLYDMDKYYIPLVVHSYFGTMTYITVVIAVDTMFMVYVQHACAIFVIVGYQNYLDNFLFFCKLGKFLICLDFNRNRLEHLVDNDIINIDINPRISSDKPYQNMVKCIIEHSKALELVNLNFLIINLISAREN